MLGTSVELAMGPVAMASLLVPEAAGWAGPPQSQAYIDAALLLSFLVGAMMIAASLFRVGFLIENLLSHPVPSFLIILILFSLFYLCTFYWVIEAQYFLSLSVTCFVH
jgi:SulP family sulfate permease